MNITADSIILDKSTLLMSFIIATVIFIIIKLITSTFKIRLQRVMNIENGNSKEFAIPIRKCPFCGKNVVELYEVEAEEDGEKVKYFNMVCDVEKGGCGCTTGMYDKELDAVIAWNKRSYSDEND